MKSFITSEGKLPPIEVPAPQFPGPQSETSFISPDKFTPFTERFRPRMALEPINLVPVQPSGQSFTNSPTPQYLFSLQNTQKPTYEETPKNDSVRVLHEMFDSHRFYYENSPRIDASFLRTGYSRSPIFPPASFCFANYLQTNTMNTLDTSAVVSTVPTTLAPTPAVELQFRSTKVTNLSGLYNLLVKLFLTDVKILEEDLYLSQVEHLLLMQLVRRKFRRIEKQLDVGKFYANDELFELIQRIKQEKSAKRIEERKKFVFKHTIKKLKKEFVNSEFYKNNSNSKEVFYMYYFGDLAKSKQVSLDGFFDPLNHKQGEPTYKTLSNNYLSLIFESDHFRNDFNEYLQSQDFVIDYQKTVQKKLEKLLIKWDGLISTYVDPLALSKTINDYFVSNRQCKLPWTPNEINHAITSFKKFMKRPN